MVHRKEQKMENEIPLTNRDLLERELKRHDFWYAMSDDHRVWQAGQNHKVVIFSLMNSVMELEARALWAQYAPPEFRFPEMEARQMFLRVHGVS